MRNLRIIFVLLSLVLALGRCQPLAFLAVGGAAGVGGYKYYQDKGTLEVLFHAPYPTVWDATLKALKDLNFEIESAQQDLASGKVMAKKGDNSPVMVTLNHESDSTTKAAIKVGHLGDKEVSLVIKEQIHKALAQ